MEAQSHGGRKKAIRASMPARTGTSHGEQTKDESQDTPNILLAGHGSLVRLFEKSLFLINAIMITGCPERHPDDIGCPKQNIIDTIKDSGHSKEKSNLFVSRNLKNLSISHKQNQNAIKSNQMLQKTKKWKWDPYNSQSNVYRGKGICHQLKDLAKILLNFKSRTD
jgi:hypothetical protein